MLRFLSIRNLAVIDRLELEFEPGLTVLTGETGAGKSILVGAVGLLVGGRASAELVRTGEDQAAIEAVFEDPAGGELVVRRDISSQSGRSRAFLNGALVTSTALRDAAAQLVDLHGQHEHQVLLDPSSHLDLLDAFAGLEAEREKAALAFARVQSLIAERDRLALDVREKARREEYLQFQLTEIRRAAPKPGEDDELSTSRQVLANAERLQRLCAEAYTGLYEGDGAVLPALAAVWKRVGELATIDPQFQPYLSARETVKPQLEDLAYFLRSVLGRVRRVAGQAAGGRRPPGGARAPQEEAWTDAAGRNRHRSLADAGARVARAIRRASLGARHRELEAARTAYLHIAEALSSKRKAAAKTFSARLVASLGRSGDDPHPLRSQVCRRRGARTAGRRGG